MLLGSAAGVINAASNCAGFVSSTLMGCVLQKFNDWDSMLLLSVGITGVEAILWRFVNPRDGRQSYHSIAKAWLVRT